MSLDKSVTLSLVEALPLRARILPLLENPFLGTEEISRHSNLYSNCHGTTIHVVGADQLLIREQSTGVIPTPAEGESRLLALLKSSRRPGYCASHYMKWFLSKRCTAVDQPSPGDIVAFWAHRPSAQLFGRDQLPLEHTAIYIGSVGEQQVIFHQHDHRDPFETVTITDYLQSETYHAAKMNFFHHQPVP